MLQMGEVYKSRLKRGLLNGCLTTLIGGPVMCLCLFVLFKFILPGIDSASKSQGGNAAPLLIFLGVGTVLFLMGVMVAAALITTVRRSRELDAVFKPLGLEGSTFMLYGRQYHGKIGGRELDVYIFRGPTVEVHLGSSIATRLQVFDKGSIQSSAANAFGKQPLAVKDGSLASFAIYALDEAWAGGFLDAPRAAEAIHSLMTQGADWAIFRRVELQPGEVVLNLYRSKSWLNNPLDEADGRSWLASLQALAEIAESQPAPQVTAQPGGSTREARQKTSKFLTLAVIAVIVGVPLCSIGAGIIAYLIAVNS